MINLIEIPKQDFNYLCQLFWEWEHTGLLDNVHTASDKVELAVWLNSESKHVNDQNSLNEFNKKIAEKINSIQQEQSVQKNEKNEMVVCGHN